MMKFNIGETIIEPTNGICTMEGMRKLKVDGKDMVVYIFQAANAKVYVPADQIENRNIRRPMDREDVKRVLASLKQPVSPNRDDARMQYNYYRDIMKSGDPMKIARLLRDLFILNQSDDLKGKEKEIMESARRFLSDEIAFIRGASKTQITEQINEALRQMFKKKQQKDKEKAKKAGTDLPMSMLGYEPDEDEEAAIAATMLEDEEDDEPVVKPSRKKAIIEDDDDDEDEDEGSSLPAADDDDDDEKPAARRRK